MRIRLQLLLGRQASAQSHMDGIAALIMAQQVGGTV